MLFLSYMWSSTIMVPSILMSMTFHVCRLCKNCEALSLANGRWYRPPVSHNDHTYKKQRKVRQSRSGPLGHADRPVQRRIASTATSFRVNCGFWLVSHCLLEESMIQRKIESILQFAKEYFEKYQDKPTDSCVLSDPTQCTTNYIIGIW